MEKLRLKLTSAKVEGEVEAELGNKTLHSKEEIFRCEIIPFVPTKNTICNNFL